MTFATKSHARVRACNSPRMDKNAIPYSLREAEGCLPYDNPSVFCYAKSSSLYTREPFYSVANVALAANIARRGSLFREPFFFFIGKII